MPRTLSEQFVDRVEAFLDQTGTNPTEFGRASIGDASFILNLRRGRYPTLATADKVLLHIEKLEADEAKRKLNRKKK
jgi:predicted transcriptional regulator